MTLITNPLRKQKNRSSEAFFENNENKKTRHMIRRKETSRNRSKNYTRKATSHMVIIRWRRYLEVSGNTFQKQNEIRVICGLNLQNTIKNKGSLFMIEIFGRGNRGYSSRFKKFKASDRFTTCFKQEYKIKNAK